MNVPTLRFALAGLAAAALIGVLAVAGGDKADAPRTAQVGGVSSATLSAPAPLAPRHGDDDGNPKALRPTVDATPEAVGGAATDRRRHLVAKNLGDLEAAAVRAEAEGEAEYAEALRRRAAALRDAEAAAAGSETVP